MTEKRLNEQTINCLTFKAHGRLNKRHFMPKIVSRRLTVDDAFEGHFRSSISVFIPKLSPNYTKPHIMFHISNGASSCLVRIKNPEELIKILEEIIGILKSEEWIEKWWQISDISENLLMNNKIFLDEEFVDINAWYKSLENTIDVDLIQVKKEIEGGEK